MGDQAGYNSFQKGETTFYGGGINDIVWKYENLQT
jgi:hypothetical protein